MCALSSTRKTLNMSHTRTLMWSQVMALNESPVFMLLDPEPRPGDRQLPVKLFESGAPVTPQASLCATCYFASGRFESGDPALPQASLHDVCLHGAVSDDKCISQTAQVFTVTQAQALTLWSGCCDATIVNSLSGALQRSVWSMARRHLLSCRPNSPSRCAAALQCFPETISLCSRPWHANASC